MFSRPRLHLPFLRTFLSRNKIGQRKMSTSQKETPNANGQSAVEKARAKRLVWVDCEMTGLDLDKHRLVEIACIVSEADLEVVAEFGPVAIRQPPEVMADMSDWCKTTFAQNGLLERIKKDGVEPAEAEAKLLQFLAEHTPVGLCPLAGNSVHQDRRFLLREMPKLTAHLHPYRIVDVSTVKELVNRWYEDTDTLAKRGEKKNCHLALDDIRESIGELQFYRQHFFVAPDGAKQSTVADK